MNAKNETPSHCAVPPCLVGRTSNGTGNAACADKTHTHTQALCKNDGRPLYRFPPPAGVAPHIRSPLYCRSRRGKAHTDQWPPAAQTQISQSELRLGAPPPTSGACSAPEATSPCASSPSRARSCRCAQTWATWDETRDKSKRCSPTCAAPPRFPTGVGAWASTMTDNERGRQNRPQTRLCRPQP